MRSLILLILSLAFASAIHSLAPNSAIQGLTTCQQNLDNFSTHCRRLLAVMKQYRENSQFQQEQFYKSRDSMRNAEALKRKEVASTNNLGFESPNDFLDDYNDENSQTNSNNLSNDIRFDDPFDNKAANLNADSNDQTNENTEETNQNESISNGSDIAETNNFFGDVGRHMYYDGVGYVAHGIERGIYNVLSFPFRAVKRVVAGPRRKHSSEWPLARWGRPRYYY